MKTLQEYILESLILEKKSVSDLAEEKATEIIKIVTSSNNDKFKASDDERNILKNISDIKGKQNEKDNFFYDNSNIFKFKLPLKIKRHRKKEKYDLFIIINCFNETDIKGKLNSSDFYEENNKSVFYIVMNCKEKIDNIANEKDTLTHEISHFYDRIKELGGAKNDTYNDETINKYNKFLYYISQTEQRAFYAGFKQKLNEDKNYQDLLLKLFKFYNDKEGCKTVEEFIEKFSLESYNYRLKNCCQESDDVSPEKLEYPDTPKDTDDDETKLNKTINNIKCRNPLLFLEYKYYILDSFDSFYKFISENPKDPGKVDNERKEEILGFLTSYNNDKTIETDEQIENVYNGIVKFYNGTFSSYMNLIKNFIKKHMG